MDDGHNSVRLEYIKGLFRMITNYELIYLMQKSQEEKDNSMLFVCSTNSLRLCARVYYVDCGDSPDEYRFSIWLNTIDDVLIFDSEPVFSAIDTIKAFELFYKSHENSLYHMIKDK